MSCLFHNKGCCQRKSRSNSLPVLNMNLWDIKYNMIPTLSCPQSEFLDEAKGTKTFDWPLPPYLPFKARQKE